MTVPDLRELLEQVRSGRVDIAAALARLEGARDPVSALTSDAHLDLDRRRRCGYPEVVFCEGKTSAAVVEIFQALHEHREDCFGTRASAEQARAVIERFPATRHNEVARTIRLAPDREATRTGCVAVITAGTSDRPVAEEAVETLDWMGCAAELIVDVGVAGPHRLLENRHRFDAADAVVVVAGMEGALPSVVGGHVDCPVVAVPTSVGYGAAFGGLAALLGMLNSCASNVTVVNIDAGFKGGYVAGLIARRAAVPGEREPRRDGDTEKAGAGKGEPDA